MNERPIVLTVDDNLNFLGTLAVLLERLNFDVLPVTSSRDAIDLARVARPQVVTLSMQMPDMDCLAFMRTLRGDKDLADTPVIMITSEREKQQVWEAMSLGCIEVLDKPIELNRMHQALQRCNLYPEGRRRYLRAPYARRVELVVRGVPQACNAVTLSERGIMVRMAQPLLKGQSVEVRLFPAEGEPLEIGGEVIYVRDLRGGAISPMSGVTIRFDRVTIKAAERLHTLVRELLIGDIVASQVEPVIKPD